MKTPELISDFIKLTLVTHFVEMLSTSTKEWKFAGHSDSCLLIPHSKLSQEDNSEFEPELYSEFQAILGGRV